MCLDMKRVLGSYVFFDWEQSGLKEKLHGMIEKK